MFRWSFIKVLISLILRANQTSGLASDWDGEVPEGGVWFDRIPRSRIRCWRDIISYLPNIICMRRDCNHPHLVTAMTSHFFFPFETFELPSEKTSSGLCRLPLHRITPWSFSACMGRVPVVGFLLRRHVSKRQCATKVSIVHVWLDESFLPQTSRWLLRIWIRRWLATISTSSGYPFILQSTLLLLVGAASQDRRSASSS